MNVDPLLTATVSQLLDDHCSPAVVRGAEDGFPGALWSVLAGAGVPWISVPEEAGGAGGSVHDAAAVLRVAGAHAAPVPLAETGLLGGWLLAAVGLPVTPGPLTVLPVLESDRLRVARRGAGWALTGEAGRVPWARDAERLVALVDLDGGLAVASIPAAAVTASVAGHNLAGEPRDSVGFVDAPLADADVRAAPPAVDREALRARGAITRALLIAGALERVLDMCVGYCESRVQFGRPVGRFQAVAQQLALLAEESAMASMAADLAAVALAENGDVALAAGVAKAVAGEAASTGARLAHQVHGAIGISAEYDLQLFTRRLWSWRDEYGGEHGWNRRVGERLLGGGGEAAWEGLVCS